MEHHVAIHTCVVQCSEHFRLKLYPFNLGHPPGHQGNKHLFFKKQVVQQRFSKCVHSTNHILQKLLAHRQIAHNHDIASRQDRFREIMHFDKLHFNSTLFRGVDFHILRIQRFVTSLGNSLDKRNQLRLFVLKVSVEDFGKRIEPNVELVKLQHPQMALSFHHGRHHVVNVLNLALDSVVEECDAIRAEISVVVESHFHQRFVHTYLDHLDPMHIRLVRMGLCVHGAFGANILGRVR
mmetsp:Transcript_21450/g.36882  ORF Transcript_21450/g.36882 Transcript_21450/m.36882 type:complete len:237 (-) Transcript_21450:427-1137(-)